MACTVNGNRYQCRRALLADTTGLGDLTNQPLRFVGPDLTDKAFASPNDAVLTGPDGETLLPWWWRSSGDTIPISPLGVPYEPRVGPPRPYPLAVWVPDPSGPRLAVPQVRHPARPFLPTPHPAG
jgi:hypothetical protein